MKSSPSLLISLRASLGKSLCAAACLGFLTASANAQFIFTSFESDQGFVAGATPNNASTGWQGSDNFGSLTYQSVSNTVAYDGGQSLALTNGNGSQYFFTRTADGQFLHSLNSVSYSFYFTNPGSTFESGANIARWEMYYNSSDASIGYRAIMELHYLATEGAYAIRFSNSGDTLAFASANPGDRNLLPGSNLDLEEWNQVTVTLDSATNSLIVLINGTALSNSVALNTAVFNADSRVNALRFTTPTNGTGTTYYDYVTMPIPEPTVSLLAACGLGGLLIARWRKRSC